MRFTLSSRVATKSTLCIAVDSVSSSFSSAGSIALPASALRMTSTTLMSEHWRADTLTATGTGRRPSADQRAICAVASCSAHSPMARITPHSSAAGMKMPGPMRPEPGLRQRMSDSMPIRRSARISTCGW